MCCALYPRRHRTASRLRALSEDGELGQIWRVPKPVIYRALQRLETLGLVATIELQPSSAGPVRSLVDVTDAAGVASAARGESDARPRCALQTVGQFQVDESVIELVGGDGRDCDGDRRVPGRSP